MSNHTEENNLDPLAQLFIKPLISEVAVNEDKKEEVAGIKAIEALLGPDVKKVEPGTVKEIPRNIQEDQSKPIVQEIPVAEEIVEDDSTIMTSEQIGQFASQVVSPNYNDLSKEQKLILDDYSVDLIEKNYGEGEDYTIEPQEIALKVNSIWQNQILPNVSFDRLNATELEKFTQQYVPIFNPVSDFIGDIIRNGKTGLAQSDVVDPVFELIKKGGEVTDED